MVEDSENNARNKGDWVTQVDIGEVAAAEHRSESNLSTPKIAPDDPLGNKFLGVVFELLEAREVLLNQIAERDEELHQMKTKIQTLSNENQYLEQKIEHHSRENAKMQEVLADQKMKYEQLKQEFAVYREENENKFNGLREKLREKELAQRAASFAIRSASGSQWNKNQQQ
ncbi:hypothetical protein GCM10025857_23810 [Alicyclobacillus contaminans]|uniref:hypothetical protein n=1 Tax=Alicyclobacillus contaminans TaxID=392016 RepID=UPI00047E3B4A|nr:hypothetical protein [Alicyclobacillus contaminans]GMA51024.1 hypothetical protein GCM10025857_23810 [Alicyclobacillus contaminans]